MTYRYGVAGEIGVTSGPVQNNTTWNYEFSFDATTGNVFVVDLSPGNNCALKDPTGLVEGVTYTFILQQSTSSASSYMAYEAAYLFPTGVVHGNTGNRPSVTYSTSTPFPPLTNVAGAVDVIRGLCARDSYGTLVLYCDYLTNVGAVYSPTYGSYYNNSGLLLDNASSSTQYCEATDATHLNYSQGAGAVPFSISAWIKSTASSPQAHEAIVTKMDATGKGYSVHLENGYLKFVIGDGTQISSRTSSSVLTTGVWHHVVMSWYGSTGNAPDMYIDGQADSGGAYQQNVNGDWSNTAMFNIGRNEGLYPNSNFFTGNIDSVSVWKMQLYSQHVTDIYTNTNGPTTGTGYTDDLRRNYNYLAQMLPNLDAWYRFGDESVNAYIGTPIAPTDLDPGGVVVDEGFWKNVPRKHLTPVGTTNATNNVADTPAPPPPPFVTNYSLLLEDGASHSAYTSHISGIYSDFTSKFTASIWFQVSRVDMSGSATAEPEGGLLCKWDSMTLTRGWYLRMDYQGFIRAGCVDTPGSHEDEVVSDKPFDDPEAGDDGHWHHAVITYDGTIAAGSPHVQLFLDGEEHTTVVSATFANNSNWFPNTHDLFMGLNQNPNQGVNASPASFNGRIDEPAYWQDVVMTETEIAELYNFGRPADLLVHSRVADMTIWYRCGDATGDTYNTMQDQCGNQNSYNNSVPAYDASEVPHWGDHKSIALGQHGQYSTYFDRSTGSSERLEAPSSQHVSFDGNSPFTISIWCKPDSTTKDVIQQSECLVSKTPGSAGNYTGWHLLDYGIHQSKVGAYFYSNYPTDWVSVESPVVLPAGTWSHVVLVYINQTDIRMYIDGFHSSTMTTAGTLTTFSNSTLFMIGQDYANTYPDRSYQGYLDETSVWLKALSAQEVFDLYNGQNPTDLTGQPGLAHWWRMGDDPADDMTVSIRDQVRTLLPGAAIGSHFANPVDLIPQSMMTNTANRHIDSPTSGASPYLVAETPVGTGTSVLFDAAQSQYIQAASNTDLDFDGLSPFSISAWVKPTSHTGPGSSAIIFGKSDGSPDWKGYALYFHTVVGGLYTKLGMAFRNDNYPSNRLILEAPIAGIPAGQWSHVVMVFENQSTAHLYVDGAVVSLTTVVSDLTSSMSNTSVFQMGDGLGGGYPYDGQVDDTSVWDVALSLSEVQEIFNSGALGDLVQHSQNAQLTNWWKLGDYPGDSFAASGLQDSVANLYLQDGSASMTDATNLLVDSPPPSAALTFSDTFDFTSPFTISFWVKQTHSIDLPNPKEFFYSKMKDMTLGGPGIQAYHEAGFLYFDFVGAHSTNWTQLKSGTQGILADYQWHHIAIVWKGLANSIYPDLWVDGAKDWNPQMTGNNLSTSVANTTEAFMIGARADVYPSNTFNGQMDEFSIWTDTDATPFDQTEILELYNNGSPGDLSQHSRYAELLAWYRLGDSPDNLESGVGKIVNMNLALANSDLDPIDTTRLGSIGQDVPSNVTSTYHLYAKFDGSASFSNNNTRVRLLDEHGVPIEGLLTYDQYYSWNYSYDAYIEDANGQKNDMNAIPARGFTCGFLQHGGYELNVEYQLVRGRDYIIEVTDTYFNQTYDYNVLVSINDQQQRWGTFLYPDPLVPKEDSGASWGYSDYGASNWRHTHDYAYRYGSGTNYLSPACFLLTDTQWNTQPNDPNSKIYHRFTIP